MRSRCQVVAALVAACLGCWLLPGAGCPKPGSGELNFNQVNLVSDGSQTAAFTDANLVNPWGLAQRPGGPFWIADNHSGVSTAYSGSGEPFPVGAPVLVTIPTVAGETPPAPPTGIVFNSFAGTGDFGDNLFIFVTEDGTIAAWKAADGATATIVRNDFVADTGPVYKGATLVTNSGGNFLLVTDFRHAAIAVFDKNFAPVMLTGGKWQDSAIPAGFAPFNVQLLNGKVYVTYAKQDAAKHDDVGGLGNGFVDEFDTSGTLLRQIAAGDPLNSPWGLAIGPSVWSVFANDLLVGNFGDGTIHAYSLGATPSLQGTFTDEVGAAIVNPGLWALVVGDGTTGTDTATLYLTAGGSGEDRGLFASLAIVKDTDIGH